jgi:uncharacterized lipoprotein YddW (UPF0748 family)
VLFSSSSTHSALKDLKNLGFNTVYPTVWNDGYTLYPSAVAKKYLGEAHLPHAGLAQRDFLAELIDQAHSHQLRVVPWFELGLMTPQAVPWAQDHPDWFTVTHTGDALWWEGQQKPRLWLNPLHPQVQQLITALLVDLVERYDLDGIQLDDHFGYPAHMGYDRLTRRQFQQAQGGQEAPPPPDLDLERNCVVAGATWQAWVDWRAEKITEFVTDLVHTLKARKPGLIISISPNPQTFSKNCFLLDWQSWQERGLIDELVLQVYRRNLEAFQKELQQPEVQRAKQRVPVVVGILAGLKNRPVSLADLQSQAEWVQNNDFAGFSFFFYESLWNYGLESPQQRRRTLGQILQKYPPHAPKN